MDKHAEHFVETLVKELEEENVAIFAGAGLSVGAGYVDWKKLLQPIAQDLELDIDQEHDLVMTTRQEFRCEVCGLVTTNPIHWFVIRCGDSELTVHRWNFETANAAGARHYCGEAHAEVYISRWVDSVCAPPKPSFK
jgi:hypothetical protein